MSYIEVIIISMTARKTRSPEHKRNDFGYEPEEASLHLSSVDERMAGLIERAGPFSMKIRPLRDLFEELTRNIIYQQLHGTAAAAIHARVLSLFKRRRLHPEDILAASEDELRGAGLSGAKLAALKDLSVKTLDGTIPKLSQLKRMEDEEIIERLTQVRGIGRWTVEMLLIFSLARPDVLPVGDFAVRKGFSLVYGRKELPKPKDLLHYGKRWRPFRSVASWYLWRVHELPPETLQEIRENS
jgi:DNA-3-methyladenine glycosylase II